jgi:hypothetical protein
MSKPSALARSAEKLGIPFVEISLCRGLEKGWTCPQSGGFLSVEDAVLSHYRMDGWRGYSGEGGLLLNLIKAMSFKSLDLRNRATYIEALYAQNVAFEEDRFDRASLLKQVLTADQQMVEKNFEVMASRETLVVKNGGFTSSSSTSMLDFFPGLERWMFVELLAAAGNALLYKIASKFAEAPYEYRRGWPDITMWRADELRFVEVKGPGDRLHDSQKKIIAEFAKPMGLHFTLASVLEGT